MTFLDFPLYFEHAIRMFLGDKAYHIAGAAHQPSAFRRWLRQCVPVMRKRVDELDTTTRHKEMLLREIGNLDNLLRIKKGGTDEEVILNSFRLIARLFGFDGLSGKIHNEPLYHQTHAQHFLELHTWNDPMRPWFDIVEEQRTNTTLIQGRVYEFLKQEGLSDFQIAQVLNTTEKAVKKLKYGQ